MIFNPPSSFRYFDAKISQMLFFCLVVCCLFASKLRKDEKTPRLNSTNFKIAQISHHAKLFLNDSTVNCTLASLLFKLYKIEAWKPSETI